MQRWVWIIKLKWFVIFFLTTTTIKYNAGQPWYKLLPPKWPLSWINTSQQHYDSVFFVAVLHPLIGCRQTLHHLPDCTTRLHTCSALPGRPAARKPAPFPQSVSSCQCCSCTLACTFSAASFWFASRFSAVCVSLYRHWSPWTNGRLPSFATACDASKFNLVTVYSSAVNKLISPLRKKSQSNVIFVALHPF